MVGAFFRNPSVSLLHRILNEVAVKGGRENTKVPGWAQLDDYSYLLSESLSFGSSYFIISVYDAAARTHILLV